MGARLDTRDGGRRGERKTAGRAGFKRAGATVGVAWDAGKGALLVAVDGAALAPLFPDGVNPGPVVGAGLFPALSGWGGCRVAWNLGQRPFRHPPPPGFLPCAAAPEQVFLPPSPSLSHSIPPPTHHHHPFTSCLTPILRPLHPHLALSGRTGPDGRA